MIEVGDRENLEAEIDSLIDHLENMCRYDAAKRCLELLIERYGGVLEALTTYPDREQIRTQCPELEDDDIRQALVYPAANIDDKVVELRSVP